MKKTLVYFLLLVVGICVGCGNSNSYYYDNTISSSAPAMIDLGTYENIGYEYEESKIYQEDEDIYLNSNRKLIKTINMDIETDSFDNLVRIVINEIEKLGGYAEQFNQYGMDSYRNCYITVRIPKNNLNVFMNVVEGQGNIVSKNERVEDVTLEYVDIESHKKALTVEQNRLFELMQMAESVDDIITIEDRLTNIRYQIESMESQLRSYDNKVDFVTINLNINEVLRYTPVEKQTIWQRIRIGFVDNIYDLGELMGNIIVWFVIYIPNIIIIAVLIVIGVMFVKLKKRKRNAHKHMDEK